MVLGRDKNIKIDEDIWEKAMKHIYECGKYDPDMLGDEAIEALIRATYDTLMEGVNKGIQTKVTPEFRSALEENTFIFSGFKTHQELKEANDLLMGEYGGLKPWSQFLGDVRKINADYNELYLRAEYRFAQQSATMASKWNSWERRGVEMLQYRTAADDHVRPEHAALDGITRPRTDKFWDTMLPPNGWRCRCTVVPVDPLDATETPADEAMRAAESVNQKPKQKIFLFNPGKTMKVFPPKHPYFPRGCSNCELKMAKDDEGCIMCSRFRDLKETKIEDEKDLEKIKELNERTKAHIKEMKKSIDEFKGHKIESDMFHSKKMIILRRSLNDVYEHNKEDSVMKEWLCNIDLEKNNIGKWKYEGWAPCRFKEESNRGYDPNEPKRKHAETKYFMYYSLYIGGYQYYANVKMHKDYHSEVLYTIERKMPNDLTPGEPEE